MRIKSAFNANFRNAENHQPRGNTPFFSKWAYRLIVYNLPEKTQNIKIDYLLVYQAGRRIII
jgi:hypothetical protein